MGWSSGTQLADTVWGIVKKHIPMSQRWSVASKLVNAFEDYDADDWDCNGDLYKTARPKECKEQDGLDNED